jgi:leader peptidase (prepilin peptidase)/N-methyltransferase
MADATLSDLGREVVRLLATAWWLPLAFAPFVGSFLGVLITRLPAAEPVVSGRSRCPVCATRLAPLDLVPLASWAWQRGRCRHCRAPLGLFYPAIELAAVAVALWASVVVPAGWLWPTCGLGWLLLTLAWIDARHLLLPDVLTLPLIPAGLLVAGWLAPAHLDRHLIGAVAGFVLLWALRWIYRRVRHREGLGLGDAKLLAAAGAWVGWPGLPGVLLIAAVAALAVTLAGGLVAGGLDRHRPIPFGPFLSFGLWLSWLYGPLVLA